MASPEVAVSDVVKRSLHPQGVQCASMALAFGRHCSGRVGAAREDEGDAT